MHIVFTFLLFVEIFIWFLWIYWEKLYIYTARTGIAWLVQCKTSWALGFNTHTPAIIYFLTSVIMYNFVNIKKVVYKLCNFLPALARKINMKIYFGPLYMFKFISNSEQCKQTKEKLSFSQLSTNICVRNWENLKKNVYVTFCF